MELKAKLSIQEMKKIFNEIIEEESKSYQLNINANPVTIKEYYQTEIIKRNLKLIKNQKHKLQTSLPFFKTSKRISQDEDKKLVSGNLKQYNSNILKKGLRLVYKSTYKLLKPITSYGWFNEKTKEIFIILTKYKYKIFIGNNKLAKLIRTAYHEARHLYQDKVIMQTSTYEAFLMQLEVFFKKIGTKYIPTGHINYIVNHDNYMLEIDANNYSAKKTIEYFQKYPELYKMNKEYLKNIQKNYKQDLELYDAYSIFEKIDLIIGYMPQKVLAKITVLKYFYKEDGNFKQLSDIINNQENIDIRILELILSSKAFLEQLNFNSLNEDEKKYMFNIIKRTYQKELQRQQKIQKLKLEQKNNSKKNLYCLKRMLINVVRLRNYYQMIDYHFKKIDKINQEKHREIIANIFNERELDKKRNL